MNLSLGFKKNIYFEQKLMLESDFHDSAKQ